MRNTIECLCKVQLYYIYSTPPANIISMHLSKYDNNCVAMDCPFMKPYFLVNKRFVTLMWLIINSLTKDSINVHTIDVTLIVLKFSALLLARLLNISETYAICHVCGIQPLPMVLFKMRARDLDT